MALLEQAVVDYTLAIVEETSHQFRALMPEAGSTHPLPFFGPLSKARVITLGLNPSAGEFAPRRKWPVVMSAADLTERLVSYWTSGSPEPHPWFQPWSRCLSELGASYHLDAAHVDLSPRATKSAGQFRQEPMKSLFLDMLRTDAPVWMEALRCAANCSLVLAAGSATNAYYINEFIRDEFPNSGVRLDGDWQRSRGQGQTTWHAMRLPGGREIPVFFCSTGPTKDGGSVLVNACRKHLTALKPFLASAKD